LRHFSVHPLITISISLEILDESWQLPQQCTCHCRCHTQPLRPPGPWVFVRRMVTLWWCFHGCWANSQTKSRWPPGYSGLYLCRLYVTFVRGLHPVLVTRVEPTKLPLDGPEEDFPGGDLPYSISCLSSEGELSIVGWLARCLGLAA
jgi:hypothetical protein